MDTGILCFSRMLEKLEKFSKSNNIHVCNTIRHIRAMESQYEADIGNGGARFSTVMEDKQADSEVADGRSPKRKMYSIFA